MSIKHPIAGLSGLAAIGLALLAGTLSGCAVQSATAAPVPVAAPAGVQLLNSDETEAAWDADIKAFPYDLADGYEWPADPPADSVGPGHATEKGYTTSMIALFYACTWENSLVEAKTAGDLEGQATATEALDQFMTLPIIEDGFPDSEAWYDSVVTPALKGDNRAITADVAACSSDEK